MLHWGGVRETKNPRINKTSLNTVMTKKRFVLQRKESRTSRINSRYVDVYRSVVKSYYRFSSLRRSYEVILKWNITMSNRDRFTLGNVKLCPPLFLSYPIVGTVRLGDLVIIGFHRDYTSFDSVFYLTSPPLSPNDENNGFSGLGKSTLKKLHCYTGGPRDRVHCLNLGDPGPGCHHILTDLYGRVV